MSLGEVSEPDRKNPGVKLSLVDGVELTGVEATDRHGDRFFIDIVRVFVDKFGKTRGSVSVVKEFEATYVEIHGAELPEELEFKLGDVLNPEEDDEIPEGRRALKIAAIAGIAGGLTLTAAGTAFWAHHYKKQQ